MEWMTYSSKVVEKGKRVASYPDHRGRVNEGIVVRVNGEVVVVRYDNARYIPLRLKSGKFNDNYDSSLDVGLIEK